jgi:phage I-like protein
MISSKAQNLLNLLDECEQEYEQLLENQRNEFLKTKESLSQFFKKSEEIQSTLGSQEEKIAKKRTQKATAEKPQSAPRKKRDGISLKEAILEVLGRSENKDGLTSKAIAEIIDSEKIWQTNGALGTQVGTNLHTLKNSGKVAREGKLYMIP